jgi:hypothetical protein
VIFHSKVVDYQYKRNIARDMAEKAGGSGFMKTKGREETNYPKIAKLTGLF